MSDEHLLMQAIAEKNGIANKRLAAETGRAYPTVCRYLSGDSTIPVFVWRRLFELTGDIRILQLVTGDRTIVLLKTLEEPHHNQDMIQSMVHERKCQINFEQEILDCLSDGKIDKYDGPKINRLRRWFPEAVAAMGNLYQVVIDQFERNSRGAKR